MPIRNWPIADRPREKLLRLGVQALSDAELLAILLGTGAPGKTAVDLARELIVETGGIQALLALDRKRFCARPGLGPAKYAQLQAAAEFTRRDLAETMRRADALTSPEAARQFLRAQLRTRPYEIFACLFLDTKYRVLQFAELFRGTIDCTTVHPRELVREALLHNAAAVILAHNHPSGDAEPSRSDVNLTGRIKKALALVDIRLLDHLVVGDREVISLSERGLV